MTLIRGITETISNEYHVRSLEIDSKNKKYYLDLIEDDTGKISKNDILSHTLYNVNDVNVLIEILEKLRDYNWEK